MRDSTLDCIDRGTVTRIKQDNDSATYAPPLTKELSPIDWTKPTNVILNQIRGLNPWPVATSTIAGVSFKIFKASPINSDDIGTPGEIMFADKLGLAVYTGSGAVLIDELQAPGGKRMASKDYLRGHPIC